MELKLQLYVFMLLIQVSLALWQRLTVIKGQTLVLSCPITDAHMTTVDWKNPDGNIMFFNNHQALRDKRYRINKLSVSEFTVSISNVTFKDGGNYTCSHYAHQTTDKIVEVTVLGHPKIEKIKHEGKFFLKCKAEGNYPPQISWKLDNGPEIFSYAQVSHEGKKFTSTDTLHLQSVENRVTVKCFARYPARFSQPLLDFVRIGRVLSSPTAQPLGSTQALRTTTSWSRHGSTTVRLTTRDVNGPSSESTVKSITAPTRFPTSTDSHLSTSGWTSVSETTKEIISNNSTENNTTVNNAIDPSKHTRSSGSSGFLVFLVTSLIFCLLVVVIFFAIKLRRAHITWKRENEDSDPSEESSKSKASQEEKASQGQRRRGILNTAFTQYVIEEPASVNNMAAPESENKERTSRAPKLPQTPAKCDIKETEL